jgi:hypothetical protein
MPTGYAGDLTVPRPSAQANRASAGSLIDLDDSLPGTLNDITRPSTAHSDVASVSGSDIGGANPFELERHASLYVPASSREPSIYVSDDSEYASGLAELSQNEDSRLPSRRTRVNGRGYHSESQSFSSNEYYSDSEYLVPQPTSVDMSAPRTTQLNRSLPPPPAPPHERVMQGQASAGEVKDEFRRLIMSFGEHLSIANEQLSGLPVRRAGGRQDFAGNGLP